MAIQMRRGLRADFDPSKMTPGEWAVAIDSDTTNQIIWMCFAPGVVKQIGAWEDYVRLIDKYLADNYSEYIPDVICPVEETSTASQAYAVNDMLIYSGKMYLVTQAIAQGDTLVPGANLTPTTVEEILQSVMGNGAYGMITSNSESSSTASQAYDGGELLIYNEVLYEVTQAISQGDTLTPGTNIAQVTIEALLDTKVDKEAGKGLSTNDYTDADKTKLAGIASGAEVNVIETVKVDGTALTPTDKAVNIDLSGKKDVQAVKTDPTASGNALAFIDSITQNTNGEITASKKNVTTDSTPTESSANPVKSGGVFTALAGKVDKETGKGLSTNDYTTAEKNKLTALPDAATLNADLASKQSLLQVTQSISGGYLYNNYYSVS